jgi:hypothetical protein
MKRKELYNYIREEIVNELSTNEGVAVELTGVTGKTVQSFKDISAANKFKSENPNIKAVKQLEEDNLDEMARTANNVKLGDPAKVALIRKLYSGTWKGNMLDVVEKAGEEGISQLELALAVGKKSQPAINPAVSEFLKVGAFVLSKVADTTEVPTVASSSEEEEWMTDADVKDDWEKSEDEDGDTIDKGPSAADIKAAEKTAKVSGGKGYAKQLPPEDEEKYNRLRTGIETKIAKIMALPKAKRSTSNDVQVLKVLINRDDVKKLFKAKGVNLNDLVSDVIN